MAGITVDKCGQKVCLDLLMTLLVAITAYRRERLLVFVLLI